MSTMLAAAREVRCEWCGNHLASRVGPLECGLLRIRGRGQETVAAAVVSIRCPCGAVWRPEPHLPPYDVLEVK